MEFTYTLADIKEVAKKILAAAGDKTCFAFFAPMGSGKTTLINLLCQELNVIDATSSPTYSLINEYKTKDNKSIVHMDWYRLKDEQDAIEAGVEDYLSAGNYCFIEWPEIAENLLPKNCLKISLEPVNEIKRKVILT